MFEQEVSGRYSKQRKAILAGISKITVLFRKLGNRGQ